MKCAQLQAHLSDYLEGDLRDRVCAEVAAHLKGCGGCSRELSELRGTVTLLRELPVLEPSATLVPEVMRRIRAGEARPSAWQSLRAAWVQLGTPRFALPVAGLAALVLYAAVSGELGLLQEGARSSERVASETVTPARVPASDVLARPLPSAGSRSGFPPAPEAAVAAAEFAAAGSRRDVSRRLMPRARTIPGTPDPLALSRSPGATAAPADKAERGRHQLDRRLDLLLEHPGMFARLMAADSVAAQELWLVELGERAVERTIDARVVDVLRNSVDPRARSMAEALAAAVLRAQQRSTAAGSNR